MNAFEKRECYLAFKSDYYTHIKDIPPQYSPGYDVGFEEDRQALFKSITGMDGKPWVLTLTFDDDVQPLYRVPPLPLAVLESAGITPYSDGIYVGMPIDGRVNIIRQWGEGGYLYRTWWKQGYT